MMNIREAAKVTLVGPTVVMGTALLAFTSACAGSNKVDALSSNGAESTTSATVRDVGHSSTTRSLNFVPGRNDYTIVVDGVRREFVVYVPSSYDPAQPTPVVFMFHGTGGNGEKMYNITGWPRQAEEEGFLAVFPSSLSYFIEDKGRRQTKSNSAGLIHAVRPGTELKDDVKFVREMLDLIALTWNIDEQRIFASGFSNGGAFVNSRLLVEMPDRFAAVATGSGLLQEAYIPKNGETISA